MSDRLGQLIGELPVPDSADARERTVAAARSATPAAPRERPRRRRAGGRGRRVPARHGAGPRIPKWMPDECRTKREYGPWEYRLYDREGRLLDRVRTLVGGPAPQASLDALDEVERRRG